MRHILRNQPFGKKCHMVVDSMSYELPPKLSVIMCHRLKKVQIPRAFYNKKSTNPTCFLSTFSKELKKKKDTK